MTSRHWKPSFQSLAKGCLYALALIVPGSLVVILVVWLVRLFMGRNFKAT